MLNKIQLENILFRVIELGCYLALFSPLIVAKEYFFPFVAPKTIFFRIVVDLIFIAYVVLAVSNPKYRPKITKLTIAIAVFIAVLFLASVFGVNFWRSFWSVFERMVGLLTFLHLFAFYIVLTSCFQERKYWERILSVSILVAVLISLYALISQNPATRGGGTLGNSSFFSSYLLFNIFFSIILLLWKTGFWRVFYGLALALFLFLLFFNPEATTKGAISSLAIGAVLFATALMFFSGKKSLRKLAPALFGLMVIAGIFIVKNFHFQDRPFNLLEIPDRSRQIVWGIGWQAWQERFWLGWGWENFNVPFAKHYKSELPATGDAWYDRVHNVVLDTGVAAGIIGLLSYLSIFAVVIFGLWRLIKPGLRQSRDALVSLALITMLIVYFLQSVWVFDMISSYIMFFLLLSFVDFLIHQREEKGRTKAIALPSFVGGLLVVLTVFTLFYGNIQPARASRAILLGIAAPSLEESQLAFLRSSQLSPIAQFEGPERFALRMLDFALQGGQNPELLLSGFQAAEQQFKEAALKNSKDSRLWLFLAKHYNNFFLITGQKEKLVLAQEALQKATELSPTNQQMLWALVQTKALQGELREALLLAERAVELEPRLFESQIIAVQVAKIMGDDDLARRKATEALRINPEWAKDLDKILESANIKE